MDGIYKTGCDLVYTFSLCKYRINSVISKRRIDLDVEFIIYIVRRFFGQIDNYWNTLVLNATIFIFKMIF